MDHFVELITTDNTKVFIRKESIDGIEEISGSARTEAVLKIYVKGFSFKLKTTFEELKQKLNGCKIVHRM